MSVSSFQCVLDLRVSTQMDMPWTPLKGVVSEASWQMPDPFQLAPFDTEEQQLYLELYSENKNS